MIEVLWSVMGKDDGQMVDVECWNSWNSPRGPVGLLPARWG